MKIEYFTSTSNGCAKKRLFCGRSGYLEEIIEKISQGKNLAIIGQRRIGKTFLRIILNDILSGKYAEYLNEMIDTALINKITKLLPKTPDAVVVDISLHEIRDGKYFYYHIASELFDQGIIANPLPPNELTLLQYNSLLKREVFPYLKEYNKRFLLVIDEFDVILEYSNILEILGHLKNLCEVQDSFSFLFFGWNGIMKRIWEYYNGRGESPFPECIETKIYLTPLDYNESKVLVSTLRGHYPQEEITENFINNVHQYSGGRAYFIQSLCEHISNTGDTLWLRYDTLTMNQEASAFIFEDSSRRAIIQGFWGNDSAKEFSLLTYIAHYPGISTNELCALFPNGDICDIIDCLTYFDKTKMISRNSSGQIYLHGKMLEQWGKDRIENPTKSISREKINKIYQNKESFEHVEWVPPESTGEFIDIILKLIEEFRFNVREKRGNKLLWHGDTPAPEVNAQILFGLLTKQYCKLADICTDREVETGRGPVDFKFSKGHRFQAHLEIKRATSDQLVHGLQKQLPTYLCSDKVKIGFYVIICYDKEDIKKAELLTEEAKNISVSLNIELSLCVIEALKMIPSASKV